MIVRFIGENKDRFGVEPMCAQLAGLGCAFAPSTYYDARTRPRSRRAIRDEYLKELIRKTYEENYSCYGARKIWLALRQDDHDVARCTVERLMRDLRLRGTSRGQRKRTTVADPAASRAPDLVGRNFAPPAPNLLWVADFTYVSTLAGWVYVAFVIDAYARRILGWKASSSMTADLVLAAIVPPLRELARALRGRTNEIAAVGTLARALRMIDPTAAEQELVSVLDTAVGRGDYTTAFVAADDLGELMRETGRLTAALSYAEQSRAFAIRAGLGPWTLLAAERSRLLALLEQGHAEQVFREVRTLADQAAHLVAKPDEHEIVMPWMTKESLLDTGRAAALRLSRWKDALSFNATAMASMRRRGAPRADLARAQFGDYGPLLSLGRTDDALRVVQECRAAAEQDRDTEMLGVTFGALAEVEDARGHREVATARCKDALRYLYLSGNPTDIAGGHARLGNYVGRGGRSHATAVAQFLAAALLHELSVTGQGMRPVSAAAAHLRAGQDEAIIPADVAELSTRVNGVPGCDLRGLLDRLWPDSAGVERAYQEVVQQVRTVAAQPPAASTWVAAVQWDPLIAALQAAREGNRAASQVVERWLSALDSQAGRLALARALRAIMLGDLDAERLTKDLSDSDAAIVERALEAIGGRVDIPGILWRAAPIAGLLLDLVMACRGAPEAPARARQGLERLKSQQEWSALVPSLERILAGERDPTALGRLADPVHRAVVALVLNEIARVGPTDRG